jgi:hypothetical protein
MTHRGVVAMKVSDTEAHIGAGKNELVVGDHVELYKNVCRGGGSHGESDYNCAKKLMGHGEVTRTINEDYSVVRFDTGVSFAEGDMIEKHGH